MELALRLGGLDVAKWIFAVYPDRRFVEHTCGYCNNQRGKWCPKCEWKRVDLQIARFVLYNLDKRKAPFGDMNNKPARPGCMKRMARVAAANGDLNVLQFVISVFESLSQSVDEVPIELRLNPDCFDAAATNGHLAVVRWLNEKREPCTTKAIDGAAKNGHLNVVQRLHKHLTVGCTTQATDNATKFGHLDIVRSLHENRTEGCSPAAMFFAATGGHLDVLQVVTQ